MTRFENVETKRVSRDWKQDELHGSEDKILVPVLNTGTHLSNSE